MSKLQKRHTGKIHVNEYLESLSNYIGLFEECITSGFPIDTDNHEVYRDAVREYNKYSPGLYNSSSILNKLEEIESRPLPHDIKWDE